MHNHAPCTMHHAACTMHHAPCTMLVFAKVTELQKLPTLVRG
eukprot:CAMPEP_0182563196 /NCGR_PEP_ID=MMETSP1324-20130603/5388_1 /TAXON_ID=236786 /ORGANISM="Florenciella sp., Strain RCC1587" /LENGTH=41 /DNA_ID= /DNA_START= /DNA_END= /DNA_ORIENTATION=